jgi:hypothetical protein
MGYVRETGLERDVDDLAAGLPLVAKKLESSGQAPLENALHAGSFLRLLSPPDFSVLR